MWRERWKTLLRGALFVPSDRLLSMCSSFEPYTVPVPSVLAERHFFGLRVCPHLRYTLTSRPSRRSPRGRTPIEPSPFCYCGTSHRGQSAWDILAGLCCPNSYVLFLCPWDRPFEQTIKGDPSHLIVGSNSANALRMEVRRLLDELKQVLAELQKLRGR